MTREARARCRWVVDRMGEFLDLELEPGEHWMAARHLLDCRKCRRFLDRYRSAVEIARDAYCSPVIEELPEEFADQLLSRLRELADRCRS